MSGKLLVVAELMKNNIDDPLPLSILAKRCGISSRHMERLFRTHVNCTPGRYYLHMRLDRAQQLLKKTNMAIIEIAVSCGFGSGSYFSQCFGKRFGIPPGRARKTWQRRLER